MQDFKLFCFYDEKEGTFKDITFNLSFYFESDNSNDDIELNNKLKEGLTAYYGDNYNLINCVMRNIIYNFECIYSKNYKIYPCSSKNILDDIERIAKKNKPLFINKNMTIPIDYFTKNDISVYRYQRYINGESILENIKTLDWNYNSLHKYLPKRKDISDDILLYLSSHKTFNILYYILKCHKNMSKHNIRYFFFNYIIGFITENAMSIEEIRSKIEKTASKLKYEKDSGPLISRYDMINYIDKLISLFYICFRDIYSMDRNTLNIEIDNFLEYNIVNGGRNELKVFDERDFSEYNFRPNYVKIIHKNKVPYFIRYAYIVNKMK